MLQGIWLEVTLTTLTLYMGPATRNSWLMDATDITTGRLSNQQHQTYCIAWIQTKQAATNAQGNKCIWVVGKMLSIIGQVAFCKRHPDFWVLHPWRKQRVRIWPCVKTLNISLHRGIMLPCNFFMHIKSYHARRSI